MDRISELLDKVEKRDIGTSTHAWMVEATNRIQELEYRLERLQEKVDDQE